MKFFVIACCFMFLIVTLFLDFWQLFIAARFKAYAEGIHIVPILSLANVFLGIYYNLSVWYKLTNKNMFGAYITIAGAAITILLNLILIPAFHYTGAAWATLICYAFMMAANYYQGQKYYPIPYAKKKLLTYIAICVLLYVIHEVIVRPLNSEASYYGVAYYGTAIVLLGLFSLLIMNVEKREFQKLPYIGKYFPGAVH
jgi:O-antigen/teichoic acid export membrane protein